MWPVATKMFENLNIPNVLLFAVRWLAFEKIHTFFWDGLDELRWLENNFFNENWKFHFIDHDHIILKSEFNSNDLRIKFK